MSAPKGVDVVVPLMGEEDLLLALKALPIDIRVVGADYGGKDFTGKSWCIENDIKIHYCSRSHELSSTELRQRIGRNK